MLKSNSAWNWYDCDSNDNRIGFGYLHLFNFCWTKDRFQIKTQ